MNYEAARSQEGLHSRHYNVSEIADQTAEIEPGVENVDIPNESKKEETSHNPTLSNDKGWVSVESWKYYKRSKSVTIFKYEITGDCCTEDVKSSLKKLREKEDVPVV